MDLIPCHRIIVRKHRNTRSSTQTSSKVEFNCVPVCSRYSNVTSPVVYLHPSFKTSIIHYIAYTSRRRIRSFWEELKHSPSLLRELYSNNWHLQSPLKCSPSWNNTTQLSNIHATLSLISGSWINRRLQEFYVSMESVRIPILPKMTWRR